MSNLSARLVTTKTGETKVEKVRVSRYRAGKVPEFKGADEDDKFVKPAVVPGNKTTTTTSTTVVVAKAPGGQQQQQQQVAVFSEEDVQKDARLRRLMQNRRDVFEGEVVSSGRRRHREEEEEEDEGQREAGDRKVGVEEATEEEEEEDAEEERRQRLRRKALLQRQQEEEEQLKQRKAEEEEAAAAGAEEDEEDEEEDDDDEDEDDDEDAFFKPVMLKPIFVPKADRVTIEERDRQEMLALEAEKEQAQKKEQRRQETVDIVVSEIKRSLENQPIDSNAMIATPDMVDDTDIENDEEAFMQWKLRELKRLKRDREESDKFELERIETERRRNLTDAERKAEDEKIKEKQKPEKEKHVFMQKYFHKGAFYQDQDIVKDRSFAAPTEYDLINKQALPKVMQVKNFGRSGQTKYTHLLDQDTSKGSGPAVPFGPPGGGPKADFGGPAGSSSADGAGPKKYTPHTGAVWAQKTAVNQRITQKLAGYNSANSFDKPTASKKRKTNND